MKKSRFANGLIAVAVIILVSAIGISGYKAVSIWLQYKQADDEYVDLRALMNQTVPPAADIAATTIPTGTPAAGAESAAQTSPDAAAANPVAATASAPVGTASTAGAASREASATSVSGASSSSTGEASVTFPNKGSATSASGAPAASPAAPVSTPQSTDSAVTVPAASASAIPTVAATATASGDGTEQTAALQPLIQKDFSQLLQINGDAVGWITLEGTPIDYPIVQGEDNAFYLDHLFSGSWGFAGTLFMDVDNTSDFSDKNTVIYGHHLKNGSMFAALSGYRDQEYYDEHPVLSLYTSAGDYEIQVFSGYARDASSIPHDFDTPEDFAAYIDQVVALSDFTSDVEIGPDDRIISLVTCAYVTDNARFVVHGKLVPLYAEAEN